MSHGVPQGVPRFVSAAGGWTLAELVMVLVIAAVLGSLAVMRFRPLEAQSLQQADRLRNDLRHMQMLALTWGRPLRLTAAAGSYAVSCVSAGAAPCNASPVINPSTGQPFSVPLESGLSLSGPGFTLDFDALGRPLNGAALISANATFSLAGGGTARNVLVSPVTGFASVQ